MAKTVRHIRVCLISQVVLWGTVSAIHSPAQVDDISQGSPQQQRRALVEKLTADCCIGETVIPGKKDLIVVIAGTRGSNVSWLADQPYEAHIISDFDKDGNRRYQGYESAAYTRYFIDHYDSLPPKLAFLHDHRSAWEINDEAKLLSAIDKDSYDFMGLSALWGVDLRSPDIDMTRNFMKNVVQDPAILAKFPSERFKFSFASGGAFLVSRDRIRLHDKATWQRVFDWLQKQGPYEIKLEAKALEFSWHILMGEEPEMTPGNPAKLCPKDPHSCSHEVYADDSFPPARLLWYKEHSKF